MKGIKNEIKCHTPNPCNQHSATHIILIDSNRKMRAFSKHKSQILKAFEENDPVNYSNFLFFVCVCVCGDANRSHKLGNRISRIK